MKWPLLFTLLSFICQLSHATPIQDNSTHVSNMNPFVTIWKTDNDGLSCNTCVTIPTFPGEVYNYEVDWENDGIYDEVGITGDASHDYGAAGMYTVAIRGQFPRIYCNGLGNEISDMLPSEAPKLISVEQWGDITWASMEEAFEGCSNLESVDSSPPNLDNGTSFRNAFRGVSNLEARINDWNLSSVIDMSQMFSHAIMFNADVSKWDVGNVENMSAMFENATSFNSDLSNWDVGNVIDMSAMFENATSFNSDLSNWYVGNVIDMSTMFRNATNFNADVSSWNVSNVIDMSAMFSNATSFTSGVGHWNVRDVIDMSAMFDNATSFNSDLSNWDVGNVIDMNAMFRNAVLFNSDLSNWDVNSVIDMNAMFNNAINFNADVSAWNVGNVIDMNTMFSNAIKFNSDISFWDLRQIIDDPNTTLDGLVNMLDDSGLSQANYEATLLGWSENPNTPDELNLGALNLKYCDETGRDALLAKGWTIEGDSQIQQGDTCDDGNPNTSQTIILEDCSCGEAPINDMTPFISTWKTDNEGVSCNSCITIPTFPGETYNYEVDWDNDGVYDELGITGDATHDYGQAGTYTLAIRGEFPRIHFAGLQGNSDASKILSVDQWGDIEWRSMVSAFEGCNQLLSVDAQSPVFSNPVSCQTMFRGATNFNADLSTWDVSNVRITSAMFLDAINFNSDLSNWDVSNITNMSAMFDGATSFNSDLSLWDVSNVVNTTAMFSNASSFNSDISQWNVSNIQFMAFMFNNAVNFNSDLANWDVSSLTMAEGMFSAASSFNSDIGNWDVSKVDDMSSLFFNAVNFNADLSNWDVSNVEKMGGMFLNATAFNHNLGAWDLINISQDPNLFGLTSMLDDSGLSQTNYEATLLGWSENPNTPDELNLGALNLVYCNETGRDALLAKGWTIEGDLQIQRGDTCDDGDPNTSQTIILDDCTCGEAPINDMIPFISTWKTDNEGVSCNSCITIPTFPGETYNYEVDWDNDGVYDELGFTGDATHDYGTPGTYTIAIRGLFPRIYCDGLSFNGEIMPSEAQKLITVDQWGDIVWRSMEEAFEGCENLVSVDSQSPNLMETESMESMFRGASSFDSDINNWNVDNITNMRLMFANASLFNSHLDSWNVEKVLDMDGMFVFATSFDRDISNWSTSRVVNMRAMFRGATSFNSDLSNWDVSQVRDMAFMFRNATTFSADLNTWDVSRVADMRDMFNRAVNFESDLSNWNTSNVTGMFAMFNGCTNFNADLSNWDVGNVVNMSLMFAGAESFNANLSNWDVAQVIDMGGMFRNARTFDQNLGTWDLLSITNDPTTGSLGLTNMLDNCGLSQANYEATLLGWSENPNTPNELNLGALNLEYCDETGRDALLAKGWIIEGDLQIQQGDTCDDGNPNTSQTIILEDCTCGEAPINDILPFISTWKTDNEGVSCNSCITIPTFPGEIYNYEVDWDNDGVYDELGITGDATHDYGTPGTYTIAIRGIFPRIYCDGLSFNGEIMPSEAQKLITVDQWGDIVWRSMEEAFEGCENLVSVDSQSPNLMETESMESMFRGASSFDSNINNWNVDNITNMRLMFANDSLFNSSLDNWNVDNVLNMAGMFASAASFDGDISTWNTGQVADMRAMFRGATSFASDLSSWDVSQVRDMAFMFRDASSFGADLSTWDVSGVTDMRDMFNRAVNFESDLSNWNTSSVTGMFAMFNGCTNFNADLSNWDVGNVVNMSLMFAGAESFNADLSNWDVAQVIDMGWMLNNAIAFDQDLSTWNLQNISNDPTTGSLGLTNMLDNSGLSQANYEATLLGWSENPNTPGNLTLGALNLEYCDETGRAALINNLGWSIEGDIQCITNTTKQQDISTAITLYPNPSLDLIHIQSEPDLDILSIEIYNSTGQYVSSHSDTTIDLRHFPSGIYLVKIIDDKDRMGYKRLVKEGTY